MSRRKALSPLLGVLIALAITVVGGLLLANIFFGYSSVVSNRPHASLESADLIVDSGGNFLFSATIKNDGNIDITSATVELLEFDTTAGTYATRATISITNIKAGETGGGSAGIASGTFSTAPSIGDVLPVRVTVDYADGSSQVFSGTVRVRSA